jgi:hypothetical protein
MDEHAGDAYTTATALVAEAIRSYRTAHPLPVWEESRIQIAEPGDALWEAWRTSSGMEGDPDRSEVALSCDGHGQFYGCVEAALADLWRYYADDEEA